VDFPNYLSLYYSKRFLPSLTVINAMLSLQLRPPPPPPSLLLTVVSSGWAGIPEACLFVLVFITIWLSSHLLPVQSYLYQLKSFAELHVTTHILRMPSIPGDFACGILTGNLSLLVQGELLVSLGSGSCWSICLADKVFEFTLRALAHKTCSGTCPKRS
jgi:hypothetical protein